MKYFLIIASLFLCSSCIATTKELSDNILLTTELKESLVDTIHFKNRHVVSLETNDKSLLRRITRVCYHDRRFFVLDKSLRKIVIFDIDGRYLNQIHAIGNGPSEYVGLMDFCLDTIQQRLLLLCDRPYQIMEFTFSGDFVKSNKINDLYFNIVTDMNYIYCSQRNMHMDNQNRYELMCMDRDYNVISKLLPVSDGDIKLNHVYSGSNLTSTFSVGYTRQFDNKIYFLENEKVVPRYSIDFGKYRFPVELLENGASNFSTIAGGKQYIYAITEVFDSPIYLIFNTNAGIYVLDKINNVLEGYKSIYDSKFNIGINNYLSIGNSQMIALQLPPSIILDMAETKQHRNHTANLDDLALFELAGKIKEDDNPVLVVYEIK